MRLTRRLLLPFLAVAPLLTLTGCQTKEPIIGKWQLQIPNLPVQAPLTVEFKEGGTGALDASAIEKAVPAAMKSNPMAQAYLGSMKSSTVKWQKKGEVYQLDWTGQPFSGTYYVKAQGDQLVQSDGEGKALSGSPAWTRIKEAK